MKLKQRTSDWLVPKLHRVSALRVIAKQFFRGSTLHQPFHGGVICLDAVEHSWAWTGKRRYETFDGELQDKLLSLSLDYEILIDIGSNLGAMTLSICLRNPNIKAICIEPNFRAVSLLQESLRLNRLTERVKVIEAAVSNQDGVLIFDEGGSVTGHVSNSGTSVKSIDFAELINEYSYSCKCLFKIDVEGFETTLMQQLINFKNLDNICLLIELHPLNFNHFGNPNQCLQLLLNSGAVVEDIHGQILKSVQEDNFTQAIARW